MLGNRLHLPLALARPARQPKHVGAESGERDSAEHGEDHQRLLRFARGRDDCAHEQRHYAHQARQCVESNGVILEGAETQLVTVFGRLDADVKIAVRPFAEPAGARRVAQRPERRSEFGNQLFPLPIRWRSRKVDHPGQSDWEAERSPNGCWLPAGVEARRGLRDARRVDTRFSSNLSELIEGEAAGVHEH